MTRPTETNLPETAEPWTLARLLEWTREYFERHGLDQPRLCAEILLAHALGCEKIQLYTRFSEVPAAEPLSAYRELVRRAARHEPIAYLTGHKEFFSLDFAVTRDVLIPRPETETLVERVIEIVRAEPERVGHIVEIGTGSGCVAVTLAMHLPAARITAVDFSAGALAVAAANAEKHGVADRIDFHDIDATTEAGWRNLARITGIERFELICSNPPYVAEADRDALPPNVREYEPAVALFAGPDGLDVYRRLAELVPNRLTPDGHLCLEIGDAQEAAVLDILGKSGLIHTGTKPDLAKTPRAVSFRKPSEPPGV